MKRFSRKWFAQIMIHRLLKKQLDELKPIIALEISATWKLSYADVIKFLIKNYKTKTIEYPLQPKLLAASKFNATKLRVSYPLKTQFSATKLNAKRHVSYSLKN